MMIEKTINKATKILKSHNIISHSLDAEIILSDIMKVEREFLITHSHLNVSKDVVKKYNFAIKRRINREPTAYIVGKKRILESKLRN